MTRSRLNFGGDKENENGFSYHDASAKGAQHVGGTENENKAKQKRSISSLLYSLSAFDVLVGQKTDIGQNKSDIAELHLGLLRCLLLTSTNCISSK